MEPHRLHTVDVFMGLNTAFVYPQFLRGLLPNKLRSFPYASTACRDAFHVRVFEFDTCINSLRNNRYRLSPL